jgi:hypothetical protein
MLLSPHRLLRVLQRLIENVPYPLVPYQLPFFLRHEPADIAFRLADRGEVANLRCDGSAGLVLRRLLLRKEGGGNDLLLRYRRH